MVVTTITSTVVGDTADFKVPGINKAVFVRTFVKCAKLNISLCWTSVDPPHCIYLVRWFRMTKMWIPLSYIYSLTTILSIKVWASYSEALETFWSLCLLLLYNQCKKRWLTPANLWVRPHSSHLVLLLELETVNPDLTHLVVIQKLFNLDLVNVMFCVGLVLAVVISTMWASFCFTQYHCTDP